MPHLSALTHDDLKACRAVMRADKKLSYSRAVSERKIESLLGQNYIYAPREMIAFLDKLFSGTHIQSFDPVAPPARSFNSKKHELEQEQDESEPLGEDDD